MVLVKRTLFASAVMSVGFLAACTDVTNPTITRASQIDELLNEPRRDCTRDVLSKTLERNLLETEEGTKLLRELDDACPDLVASEPQPETLIVAASPLTPTEEPAPNPTPADDQPATTPDTGTDTTGADTGTDTGGDDTGGSDTGGTDTGGDDTGGSDTGGTDTGGDDTGDSGSGGNGKNGNNGNGNGSEGASPGRGSGANQDE